jgi:glycosyltransferase involved in cell wall biosynthesis
MMNIIFLGGFFPEDVLKEVVSKSKQVVQNASNNFQWAFINGLKQNLNNGLTLITAPFIGYYPFYYSDLYFQNSYFSFDNKSENVIVGFLNVPVLKNIFKYYNIHKHLNQNCSKYLENNVIIIYSLNLAYLAAAFKVKKNNPSIKVYLIITDLPDYPADCSLFYRLYLKYIEKKFVYDCIHKADGFVLLTDKMAKHLPISNKPWVRVEGLYDVSSETDCSNFKKEEYKTILYTGTLDFRYGITNLLDAFNQIKEDNYRLWICGGGVGQEAVVKACEKDSRIKYFGTVGKQKIIELQKKATILVNPRNNLGDYNSFSFPSKTMEYFASGTPTLLYRLDGIPQEYFQYCYTIDDNSIVSFTEAIKNVLKKTPLELEEKGKKARNFILNTKTSFIQCKKVIDMINNYK